MAQVLISKLKFWSGLRAAPTNCSVAQVSSQDLTKDAIVTSANGWWFGLVVWIFVIPLGNRDLPSCNQMPTAALFWMIVFNFRGFGGVVFLESEFSNGEGIQIRVPLSHNLSTCFLTFKSMLPMACLAVRLFSWKRIWDTFFMVQADSWVPAFSSSSHTRKSKREWQHQPQQQPT